MKTFDMPSSLYFSMENKSFVSSLSSSTSSLASSSNNENVNFFSSDSDCTERLNELNSCEPSNKIQQLDNEIKDVRVKITKIESEITKEKSKLNTNSLSLQRHNVNLNEWENMLKLKMDQLAAFVQDFKQNVFYSNDSQLNKLLFKNNYYADLNTEIFDLQEKNNYLCGVVRQLQSGIFDSKTRIEELKKKQEQLRIKQSHLQNQCDREIFRMKNKI